MYTATLMAQPGQLERITVEALRGAWAGDKIQWLSPNEAAEFQLPTLPDNHWDVWDDLQKIRVDLVMQATENRRKKLLLADMDSTMIQQECIDELANVAGVGDQVKDITIRSMNGELDFDSALIERVALLKNLDATVIEHVLASRITLTQGGRDLVATMKAQGAYCALVSGGFTAFATSVAAQLGFDEVHANTLQIKDGKLRGTVAPPILGRAAKVETLDNLAQNLCIESADVIAIGDGANDLEMLEHAGTGIALHAKPAVAAQCDMRVNFCNLSAVLFIQGYHRNAFA